MNLIGRLLHPGTASLADAPEPATVRPDAESFAAGTGRVGVLLCHGFTGTPASLRPWAEHLVSDGFRVTLPRLPGHGTSWQELNATSWQDWYAAVEVEFRRLRATCDQVFVAGLSMGGSLALRLAEEYGDDVAGLALVNPAVRSSDLRLLALPVLHRLVPSLAAISSDIALPRTDEGGYDRTPLTALHSLTHLWRLIRPDLHRINQPLLLFRSVTDHVVDPGSARMILERISSVDVEERLLTRSYHVATLDYEAPEIFAESSAFFGRLRKD